MSDLARSKANAFWLKFKKRMNVNHHPIRGVKPRTKCGRSDALMPGRLGLSCKANAATPGLGTSACYISMEHRHYPAYGLATIHGFGVGGQELEQFMNAPMRTILDELPVVRKCPIKRTPIRYPQPICNSIDLIRGALHTTKRIRWFVNNQRGRRGGWTGDPLTSCAKFIGLGQTTVRISLITSFLAGILLPAVSISKKNILQYTENHVEGRAREENAARQENMRRGENCQEMRIKKRACRQLLIEETFNCAHETSYHYSVAVKVAR